MFITILGYRIRIIFGGRSTLIQSYKTTSILLFTVLIHVFLLEMLEHMAQMEKNSEQSVQWVQDEEENKSFSLMNIKKLFKILV